MPVKSTAELADGLKKVHFERTPVMSTYLLTWAVGELEYVEALTERHHGGIRIPVRVYTPLGLSKYGTLALECARRVLDLFQQLFKIDYPIPKSDHLVVPEFVSGAMEGWGLITYKPTKILFDPQTSNNRVMSKAVYVVAHELAHQWFGNLVTMNSWSELWLNEGFATWAGYLAVDSLFPEWNIWGQYVAEIMDDVLKVDSLPTTHAIETRVQDENDALQMFDQISYFKASSIIRTLAMQIGQDIFLEGLVGYLE
ncbi:Aminopeptidase [Pleurostoma richardsiae]|uniref:Aminopeptidase n=1 Tax=Pleurostoma richardsiae TaxID=41990 RepID=A0AA38S0L2_9PEZI|nr:Aminopeptidase [Pleurostoma richardsiae]